MFSKFQANPSAQTVILETIGVVTGIIRLGGEDDISLETSKNASDMNGRINALLRKPQGMHAEIREFLTDARDALSMVAATRSAKRTDVIDFKTRQPWLQDNPVFHRKLERMRSRLGAKAAEVFDNHFLSDTKEMLASLPAQSNGQPPNGAPRYAMAIAKGLNRL